MPSRLELWLGKILNHPRSRGITVGKNLNIIASFESKGVGSRFSVKLHHQNSFIFFPGKKLQQFGKSGVFIPGNSTMTDFPSNRIIKTHYIFFPVKIAVIFKIHCIFRIFRQITTSCDYADFSMIWQKQYFEI